MLTFSHQTQRSEAVSVQSASEDAASLWYQHAELDGDPFAPVEIDPDSDADENPFGDPLDDDDPFAE